MKFRTKLWKRSQKSFATTVPHIAILHIDESSDYNVVWEYNADLGKWVVDFEKRDSKKKKRDTGKRG